MYNAFGLIKKAPLPPSSLTTATVNTFLKSGDADARHYVARELTITLLTLETPKQSCTTLRRHAARLQPSSGVGSAGLPGIRPVRPSDRAPYMACQPADRGRTVTSLTEPRGGLLSSCTGYPLKPATACLI